MKIMIITYGSRGDVQPYVALGKGFLKADHDVMVATSCRFKEFVTDHGLEYGYMGDELLSMVDTDEGRNMLENTRGIFSIIMRTVTMMKRVGPLQRLLLNDSFKAALHFKPDIILFHPKAFGGPSFAEKLGIPAVLALVIPMFVPTSERPNFGFPDLKMKWFNRFSYFVVNKIMALSAGKFVKEFRRENNLPVSKKFDLLKDSSGQSIPVIHGFSREVLPEPSDWPCNAYVTGYWFLDTDENSLLDKELENFINSGSPPVYVGFGSMAGKDPERLTKEVVEAVKKAGVRAVLATGWGGLKVNNLPDCIYKIDNAPHHLLFPKMAAIVHHGGAGTTAAALKAGKPSVIVPFFGDQPYWGKIVEGLGAGSKPIPMKRLNSGNLSYSIKKVLSDQRIIERSKEIAEKIKSEDGITNALKIVEEIYGK